MIYRLSIAIAFILATVVGVAAQANIRQVDLKNFTHSLSCGDTDPVSRVRVRNGEFSGAKNGLDVYLKITDVVYGDIDRDGKDEAVVLYSCGSGASYVYIWGLVYSIEHKKPVLITTLAGGNKGDGGFYDLSVKRNLLIVQRYQLGTAGSPCCPETIETIKYKLLRRKLRQAGRASYRKIVSESR